MSKGQLEDRVALITGAGSGVGRSTALLFAREGAKVVVADINEGQGHQVTEEIKSAGGRSFFVRADVSHSGDVERMVQSAIGTYGRIDILHNNAGILLVKFLEETTEEEWDRVIDVNLKSIFLAVKYTVPQMKARRSGTIINTASTGGFIGQYMTPAYIASKGGVVLLTRTLALDYAQYNIRVNCICPGAVDTPMIRQHFEALPDPEKAAEQERKLVPLKRFLEPDEIAHAALYLASDRARGVTGSAIVIDGGTLAGYVD